MKHTIWTTMAAVFVLLAHAQPVSAVAPANSTITNTASLTYTGLVNPITASVDVKVLLVPAAATVIAPAQVTVAEGQTATLNYVVRANANGPDTYTFNPPVSTPTNVVGSSTPTTPASIVLGATSALQPAAVGDTAITVPADGAADANVNGIAAGDTVFIAGNVYTVASVTDNAAGSSTITLTTPLLTAVPVGSLIAEQQTVAVSITSGTVTPPAASGIESVVLVTQNSVGNASAPATGTVNVVTIVFTKSLSVNGGAFLTTLQNVQSGNTLTYRMVAKVPANTTLNGVTITDTIPPFMTYVAGSTTLDTDGPNVATAAPAAVADVAGTTPLVGGLPVNSTGQAAGTVVGGTAGWEVSVEFKVTVD